MKQILLILQCLKNEFRLGSMACRGLFFAFSVFSSVQSVHRVQLFVIPWTAAHQASLSITSSSILSLPPADHPHTHRYVFLIVEHHHFSLLFKFKFFHNALFSQMNLWMNFQLCFFCVTGGTIASLFSSVQTLGRVQLFATPWTAAHQATLSITSSWSLLKLMSIESVMPSNHLILYHPLLLPHPIFPSIRVFSEELVLHIRWPKYWEFQLQHQSFQWIFRTDSFRMDWLDLLAVQGTLKSLQHHHSSKASILRCSAFFIVQLSYPYMTTGKTKPLTRQTFVGKATSLLFNVV